MLFYEVSSGDNTKRCKSICQTVARVVSYEDMVLDRLELRGFAVNYDDTEPLGTCAAGINGLKYVFYDDDADVFAFVDENYLSDFQEILSEIGIEYYFAVSPYRR